MRIYLIEPNSMIIHKLPSKVQGIYNIFDYKNDLKMNLINIEAINGMWQLIGNEETQIIQNNLIVDKVTLNINSFYYLKNINDDHYSILYCSPTFDNTYQKFEIKNTKELIIGRNSSSPISYNNPFLAEQQAKLIYNDNKWHFTNLNLKCNAFLNNYMIYDEDLNYGDNLFIMGLNIVVFKDFLLINNPQNRVTTNYNFLQPMSEEKVNTNVDLNEKELELELYNDNDYFLKTPRFVSKLETVDVNIDSPPSRQDGNTMPAVFTLGPMITMGASSMVSMVSILNQVAVNKTSIKSVIPELVICIAMLCSMVLWPILLNRYEKKQTKKRERIRQKKYKEYIDKKRIDINREMQRQTQILYENHPDFNYCNNVIMGRKTNLWSRKIEYDDFLELRLGIGNIKPYINISYTEADFTMEEDNLKDYVHQLINDTKWLPNVPLTLSFAEKNIVSVISDKKKSKQFIDNLLLQMLSFYSYDDLKIVIFTNEENAYKWNSLKCLPNCWDDDKQIRFFATNTDEMKQLSNYLLEIFYNRKYNNMEEKTETNYDYKSFAPYYFIIVDDLKATRNLDIIKNILDTKRNIGFSLLLEASKISECPDECNSFLCIEKKVSGYIETDLNTQEQKQFVADLNSDINMDECCQKLANIPLSLDSKSLEKKLPKSIGFLEMFNVGKIEQLNPLSRWENNKPTISLQAPVGVDMNGDSFILDLHEKFHGPHGLVAGMTGSGKSEFIITYILSMAINYHPYEVAFVLIDYKGGGLAGAFENKETGLKLPHLVGTITNLDKVEMNRSLASIQSELRRRQTVFNRLREKTNESTIDIYKYQKFFRDGVIDEPIPHLFIICDEFAELKSQQPEFMEQLISAARIGRSLGVHLILATQKPSGVVNEQIWSNSKFKVCLKVQDSTDSSEMIRCPDAAYLKETGRFYLQVGYNELFMLGQSAWSGAPYIPSEIVKKKVDSSILFVDNIGYVLKTIEQSKNELKVESKGEQLTNIVKYLSDLAKQESIFLDQLWLPKIPEYITLSDLIKKYNYHASKNCLNPIIGEYDDPNNQRQDLLTLPLSNDGNAIIYGSAGSGIENFVTTLVYSLISFHSPEELNLYLLDFGAETLRMFQNAPQVGDFVTLSESEKVNNLFQMIQEMIETRKKLFADFNGNYEGYIKNSGKQIPMIVVIINNYEAFADTYDENDEILIQLTRDGFKAGIIFVISASNPNSVRYRLIQNCKQILTLQLNDESDYSTALGKSDGVRPSDIIGRGLIRYDNVYEFQTAYICEDEKLNDYIKSFCKQLQSNYHIKAKKIPVLPEVVTYEYVKDSIVELNLPIGIDKDTLGVKNYNFKGETVKLITGQNVYESNNFIKSLIFEASIVSNNKIVVIDAMDFIDLNSDKFILYNSNFDVVNERITSYVNNINSSSSYQPYLFILIGLDKYKEKVNEEAFTKFTETLILSKNLNDINFIIMDELDNIGKFDYDEWYTTCIKTNDFIWIGNGINEQYKLSVSQISHREEIDEGFGFVVENSKATLVKLIDFFEE